MDVFLWHGHLIVSSSATEHTALCLHPSGYEGEPLYHGTLASMQVPTYRPASFGGDSGISIKDAKHMAVDIALQMSRGNKTQAARSLGCSVRTVRNLARQR